MTKKDIEKYPSIFKHFFQWLKCPQWARYMARKKYRCPYCNKKTVEEHLTGFSEELGEQFSDYFCFNKQCSYYKKEVAQSMIFKKR